MCEIPKEFSFQVHDARRISRNKLHKYLIRGKSDEKVISEISTGHGCVYQQTVNGCSSLFIAIAKGRERIVEKLMEIYEKDYKSLKEHGYDGETAVLIAFGAAEGAFVEKKLEKLPSRNEEKNQAKFLIISKSTNESQGKVNVISPKNDDEQKCFLELIEKLHKNGTFDVNVKNTNNESLFYAACSQGKLWMVEKLLELGVRSEISGDAAFKSACKNNRLDIVKWYHKKFKPDLLKLMMEGQTLCEMAGNGSFETFEYIMSEIKRFDGDDHLKEIVNHKIDCYESSFLMKATVAGKFEFVRKCLKFEPDLSLLDSSEENVLHKLIRCNPTDRSLIKLFLNKQPALCLIENSNQWTPLHLLAVHNMFDEFKDIYARFPSYKTSFFKIFADTPTALEHQQQIWSETPGHQVLKNVVGKGFLITAEFILNNHLDEFDSSAYISGLISELCRSNSAEEVAAIHFVKRLQQLKSFNINSPSRDGNYAILTALSQKRFDIYKHLIESCVVKDWNVMKDPSTSGNLLFSVIWKRPIRIAKETTEEYSLPNEPGDSSDDECEVAVKVEKTLNTALESEIGDQEGFKLRMFEIFKDLIDRRVDPRHKASGGVTLLHAAVKNDNIDVVHELIRLGLKVDGVDDNGNTPLHHVKSVDVFRALTEQISSPEFVNSKNATGQTAFMNFVELFGMSKVPEELFNEFLKLKADITAADNNGYQPIHHVFTEEWIKTLLEHGADINSVNYLGENAAHNALRKQKWKFARFLLHHTDIDRFAVNHNEVSYLGYVTMGNVNFQEIFDGELKPVFDELVAKFMNDKTLYGGLQINAFVYNSDLGLIQHPEAVLHKTEADGQTSLHRAITFKTDLKVIQALVNRGIDINAVNQSGFTPLMFSIDYHCTDVALFLIEQDKINLNLANMYGFTALHYAARTQNVTVMCRLLAAGADPSISTNDNQTFYNFLCDYDKKMFSYYASAR